MKYTMAEDRVSYKDYYDRPYVDCEKRDNKIKIRLIDCVKLGFGFYIGFTAAHIITSSFVAKQTEKTK